MEFGETWELREEQEHASVQYLVYVMSLVKLCRISFVTRDDSAREKSVSIFHDSSCSRCRAQRQRRDLRCAQGESLVALSLLHATCENLGNPSILSNLDERSIAISNLRIVPQTHSTRYKAQQLSR